MPRGKTSKQSKSAEHSTSRSTARSAARPATKSKAKKPAADKLKVDGPKVDKTKGDKLKRVDPEDPTVVTSKPDNYKDPDVENQADVEDINELINNEIETDEEWESDEMGTDDGYDPQYDESEGDDADDCAYDVTRRKKPGLNLDDIDEDDVIEDDNENDDPSAATHKNVVPNNQRICRSMITKYERVRLIADRTTQLALGAKPMIRGVDLIVHSDREKMIAQLEFEARVIPIILERERPDGAFEHWKLSELRYKDDMIVYGKDAFADPSTLVVNPEYLKKRNKELQSGGNITGFTKVTQNSAFSLPKNRLESVSASAPLSSALVKVFDFS